jgi:hypothetical protein
LQHEDWRKFRTDKRTSDSQNFIDGDLIESFADLSRTKMEEVIKMMKAEGWTAPSHPDGRSPLPVVVVNCD